MGPPGTGKTTLIKRMLLEHEIKSCFTYDERLFKSDTLFLNFLRDPSIGAMIVEDADNLLISRETGQNQTMTRFLNVTDGLVTFPKKKMIFTTNLRSTGDIDSALVRPGRCHAFVSFRELDWAECKAACAAGNLNLPSVEKSYTLAELFNGGVVEPQREKVGFLAI